MGFCFDLCFFSFRGFFGAEDVWGVECWVLLVLFWNSFLFLASESLAALMALDFRRGNPTAFLRQTGMPDMSFLSVFLGGSPCDCVCCKAEGRGV